MGAPRRRTQETLAVAGRPTAHHVGTGDGYERGCPIGHPIGIPVPAREARKFALDTCLIIDEQEEQVLVDADNEVPFGQDLLADTVLPAEVRIQPRPCVGTPLPGSPPDPRIRRAIQLLPRGPSRHLPTGLRPPGAGGR